MILSKILTNFSSIKECLEKRIQYIAFESIYERQFKFLSHVLHFHFVKYNLNTDALG
jgi:hypothetical protein